MTRYLLVLAAVAACSDPPPLIIDYALASQINACQASSGSGFATSCSEVALPCDTYLLLNIIDPSNPDMPVYTTCKPVTGRKDLCSIAGVDLGMADGSKVELPDQNLQVQIAIYATSELATDDQGNPQCPSPPTFDDHGMVEAGNPMPAIGGAADYHPGDAKTVVTLGCSSQFRLDACSGMNEVAVTASAIDLDTDLAVSSAIADNLVLSVGEPTPPQGAAMDEYALSPGSSTPLARNTSSQVPSWGADVATAFQKFACVEVLDESSPPFTPVLTCQTAAPSVTMLDFTAVRVSGVTLTEVLAAAHPGLGGVPATGITVGVVVDYTGTPVTNATVSVASSDEAVEPTVQYLSADGSTLGMPNTGSTSINGIFVVNAPFGSVLTAHSASLTLPSESGTALGGDVDGKVTAVVLQFKMQMGN
ncbi:MAG TPA: hypothetical protein VMJ10_11600 [Kofleriaceae bacterium]|nr:hypothetical protein [Kofleriaceae bacterium]